jgi:hypothetical protein
MSPERRPFLVMWQVEPLPLASDSEFARQRPSLREIVKILLRDPRITDPWSNGRSLLHHLRQGQCDLVVVSSSTKHAFLAQEGYDVPVIPLGYHRGDGELLALDRDIDVLFIGALEVPRRKRLLRDLQRAGINVKAVGRWGDPRYFGDARTELLNRTKILLNLARFPGQHSGPRLTLGMANGALVISEPMYRDDPYVAGEHFISSSLEEMPETIRRFLADDEERERIARQGHDFVTTKLTMARSIEQLLGLIETAKGEAR